MRGGGRRPQIELVENSGPNTLLSTLRSLLGGANAVDIQAAFTSAEGVGLMLPYLRKAAARGKVRIVTGLYQAVTEPSALRLLLRTQRQTKARLEARLARDLRFHRKLYVMGNANRHHVISGSSNLTGDGLKSNGEFNLMVRLPTTDLRVRELARRFDRLWTAGAVPLSSDRITRYEKARRKQLRPAMPLQLLAAALRPHGGDGDRDEAPLADSSIRCWRDWIDGFASARTENVVSEETDWERRGYYWYSSRGALFERGDRILLFDRPEGWAEIVVVKDTTRTATPTPEGRHFVAYQRLRGWHRRRLGRKLWKVLADVGLGMRSDVRMRRRKLTEGQWNRVVSVFQR